MDRGRAEEPVLADAPLLVTDGAGGYRFDAGREVLYQDRPGTRERVGAAGGLWTFVLESAPSARAPITRLFGARMLEEAIEWAPSVSEPHLSPEERSRFTAGLLDLRPFVLARLRAERNEETQARQDARRYDAFVAGVQLIPDLTVGCRLDGRQLSKGEPRAALVAHSASGAVVAFLRWGEAGWPPTSRDAEALAAGLADLFQVSMFEPFLALIAASSRDARLNLLRLAGAPTDLSEIEESVADGDETEAVPSVTSAPGAEPEDEPIEPPARKIAGSGRVPLWSPSDLLLEGELLMLSASGVVSHDGQGGQSPPWRGGRDGGGPATDLDELNDLGMWVAMAYESRRATGGPGAVFLDNEAASGETALVFDVSTPEAVARASSSSPRVRAAFKALEQYGIRSSWPGFDILTLSADGDLPDRLIELKSSGVHATVQSMTWNEWKSARDSRIRERFWLYLVGNLRSDLGASRPFIQGDSRSIRKFAKHGRDCANPARRPT
ncbi:MAG: DUF3883 domain-containing protein [Chloroflexi bacterium]|nr:DUF3883 domain-containing protein [Chloroflexota bacterium]